MQALNVCNKARQEPGRKRPLADMHVRPMGLQGVVVHSCELAVCQEGKKHRFIPLFLMLVLCPWPFCPWQPLADAQAYGSAEICALLKEKGGMASEVCCCRPSGIRV